MGIPAFYRWLVERYPRTVMDVTEEVPLVVNGVSIPVDLTKLNPNGMEFDNLYLDMNGIIHPCFHPEGLPGPNTYEEVFKTVFEYIDRIFSIVRPRKLLYMAIDGVAPRAKMNQQRTRRFRAAKDATDKAAKMEKMKGAFESEGETEKPENLDSNVITPGTEFMSLLSSALQYYVHLRMNENPGWQGLKVILSDASVPGEGEHKIMSYIRLQRNLPGFDPNTRHCLYGLDADLIMLALATHEIHFSILREVTDKGCLNKNHARTRGKKKSGAKEGDVADVENIVGRQKFQFLNVWILREYLVHDLRIPHSTVEEDLERLLDDFVFMCLFVGNDFLPHVPSLEISEGAIDLLMTVYKQEFARMGGYLTNSYEINLERVEHFVKVVGFHEGAIFRRRNKIQQERENKVKKSRKDKKGKKKKKSESFSSSKMVGKSVCQEPEIVKLEEDCWKELYYAEKFEAETEADREKFRGNAVLKYVEGICWVMRYYYQGVCSWQWFYPYHYAPFASDFFGLNKLEIHFTLGEPFKPLIQLMGVLPAASAHALPSSYRRLMTDESSPILDFYPSDFKLDMNGKRFSWQAVSKLPFIEESRLLSEIVKLEHTLTDEERLRNSHGLELLFVHISHPLGPVILAFFKNDHSDVLRCEKKLQIDPELSGGMNGYVCLSDKPASADEIDSPIGDLKLIRQNKVLSVFYELPEVHCHRPRPPGGVVIPPQCICKHDLPPRPVLFYEKACVRGRLLSRRPIPNSVYGPDLAALANQLVSKYFLANREEYLRSSPNIVDVTTANGFAGPTKSKHTIHNPWTANENKICANGDKRKQECVRSGSLPDHVRSRSSPYNDGEIARKRKRGVGGLEAKKVKSISSGGGTAKRKHKSRLDDENGGSCPENGTEIAKKKRGKRGGRRVQAKKLKSNNSGGDTKEPKSKSSGGDAIGANCPDKSNGGDAGDASGV